MARAARRTSSPTTPGCELAAAGWQPAPPDLELPRRRRAPAAGRPVPALAGARGDRVGPTGRPSMAHPWASACWRAARDPTRARPEAGPKLASMNITSNIGCRREVPLVDQELLTVAEVAQRLKVHQETVRRWVRSGQLRGIKLSDQAGYRVRPSELERMLRELGAGSTPEAAPGSNEKVAARSLAGARLGESSECVDCCRTSQPEFVRHRSSAGLRPRLPGSAPRSRVEDRRRLAPTGPARRYRYPCAGRARPGSVQYACGAERGRARAGGLTLEIQDARQVRVIHREFFDQLVKFLARSLAYPPLL